MTNHEIEKLLKLRKEYRTAFLNAEVDTPEEWELASAYHAIERALCVLGIEF